MASNVSPKAHEHVATDSGGELPIAQDLFARHVGINSNACGGRGSTLPRPAALNLQLQGYAEECPDNDNERQNEDVLQRRRYAHCTYDVAGNQELET